MVTRHIFPLSRMLVQNRLWHLPQVNHQKWILLETLNILIRDHGVSLSNETILHSDQGCHYTSISFRKLLKDKELRQYMPRQGNCWDNAPQESFFGHMKDEIHLGKCSDFSGLMAEIDDYMDNYNNDRYQWGLAKLLPNQYVNYLKTGQYLIKSKS